MPRTAWWVLFAMLHDGLFYEPQPATEMWWPPYPGADPLRPSKLAARIVRRPHDSAPVPPLRSGGAVLALGG